MGDQVVKLSFWKILSNVARKNCVIEVLGAAYSRGPNEQCIDIRCVLCDAQMHILSNICRRADKAIWDFLEEM